MLMMELLLKKILKKRKKRKSVQDLQNWRQLNTCSKIVGQSTPPATLWSSLSQTHVKASLRHHIHSWPHFKQRVLNITIKWYTQSTIVQEDLAEEYCIFNSTCNVLMSCMCHDECLNMELPWMQQRSIHPPFNLSCLSAKRSGDRFCKKASENLNKTLAIPESGMACEVPQAGGLNPQPSECAPLCHLTLFHFRKTF